MTANNKQSHDLPMAIPLVGNAESRMVQKALTSGWISSQGEFISQFEQDFSATCNNLFGCAVSSGSSALYLALKALNVRADDEVIIPDLTFAAVGNAVLMTGATPIFADVEVDRPLIDLTTIQSLVTKKTKAIIVVHSYGYMFDLQALRETIPSRIAIVEDCAEAHFGRLGNFVAGELGDISCFSFFANKIISTGEGGMCLTNSKNLDERMRVLRDHGMSKKRRYWHELEGFNFRMTNIQAAIGICQLEQKSQILQERKLSCKTWEFYLTKAWPNIQMIPSVKTELRSPWFYNVRCANEDRLKLAQLLNKNSIDSRNFFFRLSDMPSFISYKNNNNVNALAWSEQGLSLPVYSERRSNDKLTNALEGMLAKLS